MTLAITGGQRTLRQEMEMALAQNLRQNGYEAFSSFMEFGPEMFQTEKEKEIIRQTENIHADAILTIVLLDQEKEEYYVPGRMRHIPVATYYDQFWGLFCYTL